MPRPRWSKKTGDPSPDRVRSRRGSTPAIPLLRSSGFACYSCFAGGALAARRSKTPHDVCRAGVLRPFFRPARSDHGSYLKKGKKNANAKALETNVSHTEAAQARIEEIHAMRK